MIDLQECRNEIDKIDSDIIRLFELRMLQNIRYEQERRFWIRKERDRSWRS